MRQYSLFQLSHYYFSPKLSNNAISILQLCDYVMQVLIIIETFLKNIVLLTLKPQGLAIIVILRIQFFFYSGLPNSTFFFIKSEMTFQNVYLLNIN